MVVQVRSLVPLAHVRSVPDSIAFYRLLGFETVNTFTPQDRDVPTWAYLKAGQAELMVGEASEPVDASQQAVLFCLYSRPSSDLKTLRQENRRAPRL